MPPLPLRKGSKKGCGILRLFNRSEAAETLTTSGRLRKTKPGFSESRLSAHSPLRDQGCAI